MRDQQHLCITPSGISGFPADLGGSGLPRIVAMQRLRQSTMIMTTATIIMTVSAELRYPWNALPGTFARGRKLSLIDRKPAERVTAATKHIGKNVTHRYFALPELTMKVVPIESAQVARSWFAMPNIGQIVETEPV